MSKSDKTDKKVKKADRKTGRKCAWLVLFALAATLCGCMDPGGQPSRSQSQNNELKDCIVIIASRVSVSNATAVAESEDGIMPNEMFTLTMKNEGSESNSPTMTPTQTTDVRPDVDVTVPVNKANAGTSGASGGALEHVLSAGADWAAGKIRGSGGSDASADDCPGGECRNPLLTDSTN